MSLKRATPLPIAALALVLLAFTVRAVGLPAQSLWYDEGYTVMFARNDPATIIAQAARLELNTPLHYLALTLWTGLTGDTEFSARLLSAFAGVLVVPLAGALALLVRPRARRAARLWAMALAAVWPVGVATSQEVRMYALVVLLCFAATAVLLTRCLAGSRRLSWAVWSALCLAAFGTHLLAVFVIAAQALVIAGWWITRRPRPAAPLIALAALVVAIGSWGAWLASFRAGYGTSYTAPLDMGNMLTLSFAALALPRLLPDSLVTPAAALMAAGTALALWAAPPRARPVALIGLVSVCGVAAFCAVTGKFAGRYAAIAAPAFAAALGLGIGAAGRRWAPRAIGAMLALACAAGVLAWRIDPAYANEDFRGAAAYLRQNLQPGEPIVLVSGHFAPVFAYYFGPSGWTAVPDDPVLDVRHLLDYDLAAPALNTALSGKDGAWLLEWQQDIVDPTHVVPELIRRQARGRWHEPDTPSFHGLGLRHFRFGAPYQATPVPLPATQSRVERLASRERGLDAIGCYQLDQPHSGDKWMEVACFWQLVAGAGLSLDARVSLRVIDSTGAWRTQADQFLAAPYALPNARIGWSLAVFYPVELPLDLPAGVYELDAVPYFNLSLDPPRTEEISPRVITLIEVLPR